MPCSIKSAEDFWGHINQSPSGCWLWTGTTSRGYGSLKWNGKQYRAHRFAYELTCGPIPVGLHALHHCDTPSCCNPAHLFLGTQADNMRDMAEKRRGRNGGPPHSQKGETHHSAKLTADKVRAIRARYAAGNVLMKQLAHEYGISMHSTRYVIRRKTWKEIT